MTQTPVQATSPIPSVRFASGTNAGIGVWLILAPFILSYSAVQPALWNDIVVGVWLLIVAGLRAFNTTRLEGLSWANVGFGVWLIVAPFVLDYASFATADPVAIGAAGYSGVSADLNTTGATWNDIVVGVLVAVLAARSAIATRGWKSVRSDRDTAARP